MAYLPPSVAAPLALVPTDGAVAVQVRGDNFGPDAAAFVSLAIDGVALASNTALPPSSGTAAHAGFSFAVGAGQGAGHTLTITVGGQATDVALSYQPPAVTAVVPYPYTLQARNAMARTDGSTKVSIRGRNFFNCAPACNSTVVTIGGVVAPVYERMFVRNNPSNSVNVSGNTHTELIVTVPAGVGAHLPVVVQVGGQSTTPATSQLFDYFAPKLDGMNPGTGPTRGGTPITIFGRDFGASAALGGNVTLSGRQGAPPAAATILAWTHERITFDLPTDLGLGGNRLVTVSVGGQASAPAGGAGAAQSSYIRYESPVIKKVKPSSYPASGVDLYGKQTLLTIVGDNFGAKAPDTWRDSNGDEYRSDQFVSDESYALLLEKAAQMKRLARLIATGQLIRLDKLIRRGKLPATVRVYEQGALCTCRSKASPCFDAATKSCHALSGTAEAFDAASCACSGATPCRHNGAGDGTCFAKSSPFGGACPAGTNECVDLDRIFAQRGDPATFGCPAQTTNCRAQLNGYGVSQTDGSLKLPTQWAKQARRLTEEDPAGRDSRRLTAAVHDFAQPCTPELGCRLCKVQDVRHDQIVCDPGAGMGAVLDVVVAMNPNDDKTKACIDEGADSNGASGCVASNTTSDATFGIQEPGRITFSSVKTRSNVPSAAGDLVIIRGDNLGEKDSHVEVLVNGEACLAPKWHDAATRAASCAGFTCDQSLTAPFITCTTPPGVVGAKNITLITALQHITIPDPHAAAKCAADATSAGAQRACEDRFSRPVLETECKVGSFGDLHDLCAPCPRGAVCAGGKDPVSGNYSQPVAMAAFYKMRIARFLEDGVTPNPDYLADEGCTTHGDAVCTSHVVPCEPKEACVGENTCLVAYEGERCMFCTKGYFKLSGQCKPCPKCPKCIFAMFIFGVAMLCIFGHWLGRKRVDLAIMSIGVDYFQVLSILAMSNQVQWPPELQRLFNVFSFANLNLDLLAPECSYPKMPYENKWAFIMSLPMLLFTFALVSYVGKYAHKRFVLRRTAKLHSHSSALFGAILVAFYYSYLYITKTALDIFNCSPTDPPEGNPPKTYLEVQFVECGKKGGLQQRLAPWAGFFFFVYSICYPAFVVLIFLTNKKKIKEDQILRAKETGNTRATNPNCYELRKKYKRLYYQFKPDQYYWILIILSRKFCIASAGLYFRQQPVFLLSFALMVLFVSYSLQVRHQPYMSLSERAGVIAKYEEAMGAFMGVTGAEVANMGGSKHVKKQFKFGSSRTGWDTGVAKSAYTYFWNYNTVEATLLFSACLVLINGLMFQSRQIVPGERWERGLLAWTVFIIVTTTLYFSVVLASEVVVGLGLMKKKTVKSLLGRKDDHDAAAHAAVMDEDVEFADTALNNPIAMAKAGMASDLGVGQAAKLATDNAQLADLVRVLRAENASLKKEAHAAQGASALRADSLKFAKGHGQGHGSHGHGAHHGAHHGAKHMVAHASQLRNVSSTDVPTQGMTGHI